MNITKRSLSFLIIIILILPISISGGAAFGKNIDLPLSSFCYLLLPVSLAFLFKTGASPEVRKYSLFLFLYIAYCLLGILFSILQLGSGLDAMFSFSKSIYPFFIFYIGFFICQYSDKCLEQKLCFWVAIFSLLLFLSDVLFNNNFPHPRWGGNFLGVDIYGFPNSPAIFYVVLIAVLMFCNDYPRNKRYFYNISLLVLSLTIIMMGSRNAWGALLILSVFYFYNLKISKVLLILLVIITFLFFIDSNVNMLLLFSKIERMSSQGMLYGRVDVWQDMLNIIAPHPLLGYGFQPLSENYISFGTAHNQYIEYIYKTGLIGLVCIVFLWGIILKFYFLAYRNNSGIISKFYYALMCGFFVCIISNMVQSNFTYTVTQHFFVFFGGTAAFRVLGNIQHEKNPRVKLGV